MTGYKQDNIEEVTPAGTYYCNLFSNIRRLFWMGEIGIMSSSYVLTANERHACGLPDDVFKE